jgi:hypothetical protein
MAAVRKSGGGGGVVRFLGYLYGQERVKDSSQTRSKKNYCFPLIWFDVVYIQKKEREKFSTTVRIRMPVFQEK